MARAGWISGVCALALVGTGCVGCSGSSRPASGVATAPPAATGTTGATGAIGATDTPAPQLATTTACVGEPLIEHRDAGSMFPQPGPIRNADPSVRTAQTLRLPTRLRVTDRADGLWVSWDERSLEPVEVSLGCHMVLGTEASLGVTTPGVDAPAAATAIQLRGGAEYSQEGGSSGTLLPRPPGARGPLVVRARLVVFETDVPTQHDWSPQEGRYRVLHSRVVETAAP